MQNMGHSHDAVTFLEPSGAPQFRKWRTLEPLECSTAHTMKRLTKHRQHGRLQEQTKNGQKCPSLNRQLKVLQRANTDVLEPSPKMCEQLPSDTWTSRKSLQDNINNVPGLFAKGRGTAQSHLAGGCAQALPSQQL